MTRGQLIETARRLWGAVLAVQDYPGIDLDFVGHVADATTVQQISSLQGVVSDAISALNELVHADTVFGVDGPDAPHGPDAAPLRTDIGFFLRVRIGAYALRKRVRLRNPTVKAQELMHALDSALAQADEAASLGIAAGRLRGGAEDVL